MLFRYEMSQGDIKATTDHSSCQSGSARSTWTAGGTAVQSNFYNDKESARGEWNLFRNSSRNCSLWFGSSRASPRFSTIGKFWQIWLAVRLVPWLRYTRLQGSLFFHSFTGSSEESSRPFTLSS